MFKKILAFLISRFKYTNKLDLVKSILNGIDDDDIKSIYKVINGRLNPILKSDNNCNYKTISLEDTLNNSIPVIIQDNNIIGFGNMKILYSNGWKIYVNIDGVDQEIKEDDHTKIYLLM